MPLSNSDFERRMKPAVRRAYGEWTIEPASIKEDTRHNTDWTVHTGQMPGRGLVRLASRVRRNKFAKHPYLTQFTIRYAVPYGETEYAKILKGWGHYLLYAFASINEKALMLWRIFDLDMFRTVNPRPAEIHPNKDDEHPSDLAVFNLSQFPTEFVVHEGNAPAAVYDLMECPLCDRTGVLPSGIICDHTDYDGQRLHWIRHFQKTNPPCSICHAPLNTIPSQKLGHHLSCGAT